MSDSSSKSKQQQSVSNFMTNSQRLQREKAEADLKKAEKEEYMKTRKWREASTAMGGGAGPESMTSEDYEIVHDIRRKIWTSGFRGFLTGGIVGALTATLVAHLQEKNIMRLAFKLEPKHRTGAILTLSALGMVLGASTTGQQNSWRMTNIYSRGAAPQLSRYQKIMAGKSLGGEDGEEEPLGQWNGMQFGSRSSSTIERSRSHYENVNMERQSRFPPN
jgi:hypothetical protein